MAFSMAWRTDAGQGDEELARGLLTAFRGELYWCLDRRPDALFELADAVLCKTGRFAAYLASERGPARRTVDLNVRLARPARPRATVRITGNGRPEEAFGHRPSLGDRPLQGNPRAGQAQSATELARL